jgi:hypothetical protein
MPRRVSDPVNRRIALALILALLVRSLLPGLAMALPSAPLGGQTLLICTEEGLKEVVLDHGAQQGDVPQAQPCCPCAIACGACVLSPVDSLGARVVYATVVALRVPSDATMPVAARVPPHQSRAPPRSS